LGLAPTARSNGGLRGKNQGPFGQLKIVIAAGKWRYGPGHRIYVAGRAMIRELAW
jgi:hypothetical protein